MPTTSAGGSLVELPLLEGPNLYFPRPAAKVTLDLTELLRLSDADARNLGVAFGLGNARPGAAGSIFQQRFAIRLTTQIVRRLARIGGVTRLAVRTRNWTVTSRAAHLPAPRAGTRGGRRHQDRELLDHWLMVTAGARQAMAEGGCCKQVEIVLVLATS